MATETDFGPNEWLVQEIWTQFREDPSSVGEEWRDFFNERQGDGSGDGRGQDAAAQDAGSQEPRAEGTAAEDAAPEEAAGPRGQEAQEPADEERPQASDTSQEQDQEPQQADEAPKDEAPEDQAPEDQAPEDEAPEDQEPKDETRPLRGFASKVVENMEASLEVPTATSVRAVAAKLLIDNRTVINRHLARSRGGKISFTHLIGYALVRAVADMPSMNAHFAERDGKPVLVQPADVNLGIAIDLAKDDGSRQLVVPSIKSAQEMDFSGFWAAYEELVRRARAGKLTMDDHTGATLSLTNPGGLGTVHSVPRLMRGQSTIIGVGALEYPAEFAGASPETLARLAVSKTLTLTSTYDHRVIQGAQSGELLRRVDGLLLGEESFYDDVFASLHIPYEPIRWVPDISASSGDEVGKTARVLELIHAYRVRGHLMADTDPLSYLQRSHPDLDITCHGLTLWDLDREFPVGGFNGQQVMSLRNVLGVLRDSYCRTTGVEYMHIQSPEQRRWIQAHVEQRAERPERAQQLHVLEKLNEAEAFETFLQTKFVGQKRFSLEGGESVIPVVDAVIGAAADTGLDEVVVAMPHRGRLNVLVNVVGKSVGQVFQEFEGNLDPAQAHGSGDVKYHLGAEGTATSRRGSEITVSLTSNPSHLEAVDPVLEGIVRAKQDVLDESGGGGDVLALMLHGDAAFAGQGVVAETLNMSQLRGYRTGGTVHVVVNNQVGFTTAPAHSRSSTYATDVARTVQAPIFHVNGDDPDACVRVAELAFAYRQEFRRDVVIDMVCYRRRGHSEVDEPSFTQPVMYEAVDAKRPVRKIYTENLVGRGDITQEEAEQALRSFRERLEQVLDETKHAEGRAAPRPSMPESPATTEVETAISAETLKMVIGTQTEVPDSFTVHPRLKPQLDKRAAVLDGGGADWATGELLAVGSLLMDGHPVRLGGQDSRRGTFGQRHAVVVDRRTGDEHVPLRRLPDAAPFYVYDSALSEFAALGFEYGYSVTRPGALVMWEAQFGDFINGAQTVVDEFVAAGEVKWGQRSGVVLLLPHGYEGQGPDHSSARIERFLTLCAEGNMTVALPTTPANYFHLLRWQAKSDAHRPLVVFTPKGFLRLKAATSPAVAFTSGGFEPVLGDPDLAPDATVRRTVLCSGKVFYDLQAARVKKGVDDVALLRVEQLYPLPADDLRDAVEAYGADDVVWAQEEPANMGAWPRMALHLPETLGDGVRLRRVSRPASASPAVGSSSAHAAEQSRLVDAVLDG